MNLSTIRLRQTDSVPARFNLMKFFCPAALIAALLLCGVAWSQRRSETKPSPGPMLDQGYITLNTPDFTLKLVRSSQTVAFRVVTRFFFSRCLSAHCSIGTSRGRYRYAT